MEVQVLEPIKKYSNKFRFLSDVLGYSEHEGYAFNASNLNRDKFIEDIKLNGYYHDSDIDDIITNNINWINHKTDKPKFKFIYLMLPTKCNLKCIGCFMGQDKKHTPDHLNGNFFTKKELLKIFEFAKKHGSTHFVYGGGGELFTWRYATEYLRFISDNGFRNIIFTNGTLLDHNTLSFLNEIKTTLILSIRGVSEKINDSLVNSIGAFKNFLKVLDEAINLGFHSDKRLAVEIPVTKDNENDIINELVPSLLYLGIMPLVEEFIQLSVTKEEKSLSHTFQQANSFFEKVCIQYPELDWKPEDGSRIIFQPKCKRPLYSFAIFPNRSVYDCPSNSIEYGNISNKKLEEIIYSNEFKNNLRNFDFCACSVCYTKKNSKILNDVPEHLIDLL